MLIDFRVPRTRVWASGKWVFRTRAQVFAWKPCFFPHLADKLVEKSSFWYVEYRVSAFPQKPKPRNLYCSKHSSKIAAKCKETAFFHFGSVALVRILWSPEGAQKASNGNFWVCFYLFLTIFGPKMDPKSLKNLLRRPRAPRAPKAARKPPWSHFDDFSDPCWDHFRTILA